MNRVLLDTNVLSEVVRARPDPNVVAFVRSQSEPLISAITLHELRYGAERLADPARRARLSAWVSGIRLEYGDRIVAVDAEVAELAGRMRAAAAAGITTDANDAIIAACAAARGVIVATRNVRDFSPFGLDVIDPWTGNTWRA